MTLSHPLARTLHLAVLLLGSLLILRPASARAESPRFAHGFVIYKTAPSDQPAHYQGTLYLSGDTSAPIWLQFDIGEPKPFFIARDLFVSEIKFGALFEADFTSQQHVDFCKGIQAQLAAAAKKSPLIASAATAATKAIQGEIDQYDKGRVRLNGTWTDRAKYDEMLAEKEKVRKADMDRSAKAAAALALQKETDRRAREAMAEDDKMRLANLNRTYASIPAQNLITTLGATVKTSGTLFDKKITLPARPPARKTLDTYIALPFLSEEQRIDTRLQILGDADTETAPALLTTHNVDATHTFMAQAAVYFESPGPGKPFIPRSQKEYAAFRQAVDQFRPSICDSIPDLIASNTILHHLKDAVPSDLSTPYLRENIAGYIVRYDVYNTDLVEDRNLRLIIITLFPAD